MKHLFLFVLILVIFPSHIVSQPFLVSEKVYGGSSDENSTCIIKSSDGNFILGGRTFSTDGDITGNIGNYDVWILKVDLNGNIIRQNSYGSMYADNINEIQETSDYGIIACGSTGSGNNSDVLLIRTDSAGNEIWNKLYGGSQYDNGNSVKQTPDNGFIACGSTFSSDGDVIGHHGSYDGWLIKLDSAGVLVWAKTLGGSLADYILDLQLTADNGYICAGKSASSDGDLTGNLGYSDAWIIKLDSMGNIIWQFNLGASGDDEFKSVRITQDNQYIFSGQYGIDSIWVVKTDTSGNIIWQFFHAADVPSAFLYTYGLCPTSDSSFILTGIAVGGPPLYDTIPNAFILKINQFGLKEWIKWYGGPDNDSFSEAVEHKPGQYFISGTTGKIDMDLFPTHGFMDYWFLHISEIVNSSSGIIYSDLNSNSVKDSNEYGIPARKAGFTPGNFISWTRDDGSFRCFTTDSGYFSLQPPSINYYNPVPVSYSKYFPGFFISDSLNDFAYQPTGNYIDLNISILPLTAFRPGFTAVYNLHYENKGTTTINPGVVFYPDSDVSFMSSSITPDSQSPDSVLWVLLPIKPFESQDIQVTVVVNSLTPIGSLLNSWAKILPLAGDAYQPDNFTAWEVEVTGSYDPNDILVNRSILPDTEIQNPDYLDYIIRFQNTGNDTAFNVVVKNNITELLDLSTFELLSSSHPLEIKYQHASRLFEFAFNNILLVDSNMNEPLSHGYIHYRIKPLNNLIIGDSIKNKAAIYFDFNAPVTTNTALTEVILNTSISKNQNELFIKVYPNPFKEEFNISLDSKLKSEIRYRLVNTLGQEMSAGLKAVNPGINVITIPAAKLSSGIYFLHLDLDGMNTIKKLVHN